MVLNALSSLIGGIGYFHSSGLVSSNPKPEYGHEDSSEAKLGEPYSLFATTSSRPFFSRGSLWDEGFHQLVLRQWDSDLSLEIIRSWFNTMDGNGWRTSRFWATRLAAKYADDSFCCRADGRTAVGPRNDKIRRQCIASWSYGGGYLRWAMFTKE
ncbi:Processing alpha glucosidase I [Coemansia aciculifera]|nr:Processing alpha glucosidase I [Coemansia aciculifera]